MRLSATHGPVGTIVTVLISGCPMPASGYRGFFADSHAIATPDDASLRSALTVTPSQSNAATAHYTISSKDTAGSGIFEVLCGSNANATAPFTVDQ